MAVEPSCCRGKAREENLTSIHIPASVTAQGNYAFAWCTALKDITFGSFIIGPYGFSGCTGLETLVIPNNVTQIDTNAFADCTGLKSVTLPIEQSGFSIFSNCTNVETIQYTVQADGVMPKRTTHPSNSDYYGVTLEFASRKSIKKLVYGEGVMELAYYAYYDSSLLANVVLPTTLRKIDSYAFFNCTALSSITMPDNLESIAEYAFNQSALTVICPMNSYAHQWAVSKGYTVQCICTAHVPVSVAPVAPSCTAPGLTEGSRCSLCGAVLTAQTEIPSLGHAVILAQSLYETTQGEAVDIAFTLSCEGVCGMEAYWADAAAEQNHAAHNGSVCYAASECGARTLLFWLGEETDKAVTCTVIVHAAAQMILPGELNELGEEAFAGLAAEEFLLPDGVSVIGSRAFAHCADLVLISIPDSVTSIADDAFEGSSGVTILCSPDSYAAEFAGRLKIACIEQ